MKRRLRRHRRPARKESQALLESKQKGYQHSFLLMALIYCARNKLMRQTFVFGPAGTAEAGCRYVSNCSAASRPDRMQSGTPIPR